MRWKALLSLSFLLFPGIPLFAQDNLENLYYRLHKFEGHHAGSEYGYSVYLSGDLNGDGYGEILVGASNEEANGIQGAGRAYVYSGFDGSLLFTFEGTGKSACLGRGVSSISDTNKDGLPEILVGEPGFFKGNVYHYSGVDGSLMHLYHFGGAHFGDDVEGIGDIDGDGKGDFIVGLPSFANSQYLSVGAAHVYSGGKDALLFEYEGKYTAEQLGYKVCRVGDVTGDGIPDFAYLTLNNKTRSRALGKGGRVTVRSGADGSEVINLYGTEPDWPWYRLDYAGDVNNDGYGDLLVGQINYGYGSVSDAGRAFVFSGKDWTVLYEYIGRNDGERMGGSLGTVGDIDEDGHCDFVLGAYGTNDLGIWWGGAVYLHSGKDGSLLGVLYGHEDNGAWGSSVHGGADVNGDGLPDLAIGTAENVGGQLHVGSVLVYVLRSLTAPETVAPGDPLPLQLHVPARPGRPFLFGFSLGTEPGIPVGTRILPLSWDPLFALTFGNPAFSGTLDGQGNGGLNLFVPNDPSLSGLVFYTAAVVLEATAPQGVAVITNPEEVTIS